MSVYEVEQERMSDDGCPNHRRPFFPRWRPMPPPPPAPEPFDGPPFGPGGRGFNAKRSPKVRAIIAEHKARYGTWSTEAEPP